MNNYQSYSVFKQDRQSYCIFLGEENRKQYNADLSTSYNIAAGYWYAVLSNSEFTLGVGRSIDLRFEI